MSKTNNKMPNKSDLFFRFIKQGSISTLSLIPLLIAVLIMTIYGVVKLNFFPTLPKIFNNIVLFIVMLLAGSVGLLFIYRKEMPGPISSVTIKGKFAVFSGLFLIVFSLGMGLLVLFLR